MSNADLYTTTEEIAEGYESYTGLLIPEIEFFSPLPPPEELFQRFIALGTAIGSRNLAYWFYSAVMLENPMEGIRLKGVITTPNISLNEVIARKKAEGYTTAGPGYDYERARRYCDRYSLNYNDGPYIVYSVGHPDEVIKPDITITLKGLYWNQYVSALNTLEQTLRTDRDVDRVRTRTTLARWRNLIASQKDGLLRIVELTKGILKPD